MSDEFHNDLAVEKRDARAEAARWVDLFGIDPTFDQDDGCERCGATPADAHSSGCWLCPSCARHYDEEDDL